MAPAAAAAATATQGDEATDTQAIILTQEATAVVTGDNHATTPDLGSLFATLEDASLARPLFNIFLPKTEQRVRPPPHDDSSHLPTILPLFALFPLSVLLLSCNQQL
jgi:hypothetical protein